MDPQTDWREFFALEAPRYHLEPFVQATMAEVDFLIAELGLRPGMAVLDVGCGIGRHTVELARRGLRMTGVDLSPDMLAQARRAAAAAQVTVELVEADATRFQAGRAFDAAVCLCEGAFCLLGRGEDRLEHDRAILRNIHQALRPGGGLLLTCLNAMRLLRRVGPADVASGRCELFGAVEHEPMVMEDGSGSRHFLLPQRHYVPSELALLLRWVGFAAPVIYGGTAGNWGRRPPELDEMELMAVARKPEA